MEMAIGIALLVVFLAVVVLIVRGQSPVVMLLVLAVAWAALAGIGIDGIQAKVLQRGTRQLLQAHGKDTVGIECVVLERIRFDLRFAEIVLGETVAVDDEDAVRL